ncbi:protocatechuate dioxygenase [Euzebya tangerina]|uniref:dioxygenase family protein n=1 Tax=Euzebya tangerina TaxID=591198 RepID=UPI0039C88FFA
MRSAGVLAAAVLASGCTEADTSDGVADISEPAVDGAPRPESGEPTSSGSAAPGSTALSDPVPADFEDLPICQTTRSAAEGPFPNLEILDRRDITEGRPGQPVQLGLRVVDAECQPIEAAVVTVWHADHSGDYSSYTDGGSGKDEEAGTTFLRGQQTSGPDGVVVFDTVFPGWYEGRAVHIHLSAEAPEGRQLTTQLYFREDLTAEVLTEGPYAEFGQPDTSVQADGLAGDPAAEGTQLVSRRVDGSIQALLNIGLT